MTLIVSVMTDVKCCKLSSVSANTAVAIFRVNVYWLATNQPTKLTEGRVLFVQTQVVPC